MGEEEQPPDPVSTDPEHPDDAAAESEDLPTGDESANEPLIKKDPASETLTKGQPIVYDPDDGLDFESNMSKLMLPIVTVFLGLGWIGFTLMDEMRALDGLYMTFVTITTVGYGDFSPEGDGTKIFFIFWIFFGLSVVATGLALIVESSTKIEDADEDPSLYRRSINAIDDVTGKIFRKLAMEFFVLLLFIAVGTVWVCTVEEFGFVDGLYWSVQTLSTVGYGDLDLQKDSTKVFVIVYALFGTALTVTSLAGMACLWVEHDQAQKVQQMIEHGLTMKMINVIDIQKSGFIDKFEFLRYMLVKLEKVDGKTIDTIIAIFEKLDADGGGTLGPEDFLDAEAQQEQASDFHNDLNLTGK